MYLKKGNTMAGMPGYIDAHQTEAMDGARGGKGVGPHREGPVGKRGSSGAKNLGKSNATGTVTRSYHESSTGRAGPIKSNERDGTKHVHTKARHSMPGQKAPPTSKGKLGGTIKAAGIDRNKRSAGFQAAIGHASGHPGRMERLSGHAKTHAEGRRKSSMY